MDLGVIDSSPPLPWRAKADVYLLSTYEMDWRNTRVYHGPEPGWTPCLLVLTGKRLLPQAGAETLRQREVWGEIRLEDGSPDGSRLCAGEGVHAPGSAAPEGHPEASAAVLPTRLS